MKVVPRLLAGRDRLGRIEKDEILEAVLAGTAPRRSRAWWWAVVPAVAAIALLVAAPWQHPQDELAARGGSRAVAAFHATCAGPCARGGKLLFDVYGTTRYRYVAAFAKRGDGTVLWYFPAADGTSVDLTLATATGVLDRGIVIGDEHPAGTYRVYAVFSNTPLTRDAIRDGFDEATRTAGPGTEVVATDVVIR